MNEEQDTGRANGPAIRPQTEARRYLRLWLPWATIYASGFAILWAAGIANTWAFYVWAIGWVLAWGAWVQYEYVTRYVFRGSSADQSGDNEREQ